MADYAGHDMQFTIPAGSLQLVGTTFGTWTWQFNAGTPRINKTAAAETGAFYVPISLPQLVGENVGRKLKRIDVAMRIFTADLTGPIQTTLYRYYDNVTQFGTNNAAFNMTSNGLTTATFGGNPLAQSATASATDRVLTVTVNNPANDAGVLNGASQPVQNTNYILEVITPTAATTGVYAYGAHITYEEVH